MARPALDAEKRRARLRPQGVVREEVRRQRQPAALERDWAAAVPEQAARCNLRHLGRLLPIEHDGMRLVRNVRRGPAEARMQAEGKGQCGGEEAAEVPEI